MRLNIAKVGESSKKVDATKSDRYKYELGVTMGLGEEPSLHGKRGRKKTN